MLDPRLEAPCRRSPLLRSPTVCAVTTAAAPDLHSTGLDEPLALAAWGELDNRTHVWRPRDGAPAGRRWEIDLARANEGARAASADRVRRSFPGVDLAGLVESDEPASVQLGRFDPAAVGGVSVADLVDQVDRVLARPGTAFPRVALAQDGEPEHVEPPPALVWPAAGRRPSRLQGASVAHVVQRGSTVLLHHVDDDVPALWSILEDVERVVGTPCAANAYVTMEGGDGFGAHWDDHTVLVLQLEGSKSWEVRAPAVPHPLRPFVGDGVSEDVVWEGRLDPGDALLVPHGMGHRTSAHGASWHLTIPIQPPRWLDVTGFCLSAAGHWPLLRGDVPFDRTGAVESYGPPVLAEVDRFRETLGDVFADLTVDRAIGQWLAKVAPRASTTLRTVLRRRTTEDWLDAHVRLATPGGLLPAGDAAATDRVTLAGGQRELEVPAELVGAVLALAAAEPLRVADLAGEASPTQVAGLARDLAVLGLVDVS